MGFIPDKPYLYEKLSAREYLDFVTRIYGTGTKQIEEFADKFGIFENLDQTVESFSHGMRQRLVFAATFVHKPEFVVIDEPMVGLDPIASRLVKDFLRNFVEKGGAILLSTHTMSVVEEVADRISIIKKGSLMETGTLDEIRERALNKGNLEALFLEITK